MIGSPSVTGNEIETEQHQLEVLLLLPYLLIPDFVAVKNIFNLFLFSFAEVLV